VEGMASGVKEDIRDLPVGVAMIVGITDQPLIVDIRIRRSEHGGDNVKMQQRYAEEPETGPPGSHRIFQPRVSRDEILFRYKGSDAADMLKYPLWRLTPEGDKSHLRSSMGRSKRSIYVDGMTGSLILERDGSLERVPFPKRIPRAAGMRKEPADASISGLAIEPSFHPEKLPPPRKINAEKAELVFYPYWLVKKKGRKFLVDALSERMDMQATEAVRERV